MPVTRHASMAGPASARSRLTPAAASSAPERWLKPLRRSPGYKRGALQEQYSRASSPSVSSSRRSSSAGSIDISSFCTWEMSRSASSRPRGFRPGEAGSSFTSAMNRSPAWRMVPCSSCRSSAMSPSPPSARRGKSAVSSKAKWRSISSASEAAAVRISPASTCPAAREASTLVQSASEAWCSSCRRRLTWRVSVSMASDFHDDVDEEGGEDERPGEPRGCAGDEKRRSLKDDPEHESGEREDVQHAVRLQEPQGRHGGDEWRAARARGGVHRAEKRHDALQDAQHER